jgi:hypothetical protein
MPALVARFCDGEWANGQDRTRAVAARIGGRSNVR